MRMRKLDRGQSVMLLGSAEVEKRIVQSRIGPFDGTERAISVSDVLAWCISETWDQTKRSVPRWAVQGARFAHHEVAWSDGDRVPWISEEVSERFCESDAQSLGQRYGHQSPPPAQHIPNDRSPAIPELEQSPLGAAIRDRCQYFQVDSYNVAMLEEEQERELSPEIEQQRQVEHYPEMKPRRHSTHPSVLRLFNEGIVDLHSSAFLPAFDLFQHTTARGHLHTNAWATNLLMTRDFAQTVEHVDKQSIDHFLRPVHWIACCTRDGLETLVIVSPWEANEVMCFRQRWRNVSMHVYSARTSSNTPPLDGLTFCAINRAPAFGERQMLVRQLNLFAGQTFLVDHDEYIQLCRFLGVVHFRSETRTAASIDGFIAPASRRAYDSAMADLCPFNRSPVFFLKMVVNIRRNGKAFDKSHLGRLLDGEYLDSEALGLTTLTL